MKLRQIDEIDAHSTHATDVAFGADGTAIYSAGFQGELRCWTDGEAKANLTGLRSCVNAIALSGDGANLFSVSNEEGCVAWDLANGTRRTILGRPKAFNSVALGDGDSSIYLATSRSKLYRVDPAGKVAYQTDLAGKNRRILTSLPDAGLVVCGGLGPALLFVDCDSGAVKECLSVETAAVTSASPSPDRRSLVFATYEGALQRCDPDGGRILASAALPVDRIASVRHLGDTLIAAAPYALLAIAADDFDIVARCDLPTKGNYSLATCASTGRVALASADGRIRLFTLE